MSDQRRILTLDQSSVSTTCAYCGVGCGVLMRRDADNGRWSATGDKRHPANHGRLCVKGSALGDTLTLKRRLLEPQVDGASTDWDTALQASAEIALPSKPTSTRVHVDPSVVRCTWAPPAT